MALPKASKTRLDALELIQSGLNSREISERLGINGRTIRYWAWRNNVPLRLSKIHRPEEIKKQGISLYQDGYSYGEIASQLDIALGTIRGWIIKTGIPRRTQSETQKIQYARGRKRVMLGKRGKDNPNYKGGRHPVNGYNQIMESTHHRASRQGYVYEHILIWEQVNNRQLPKDWIIHHLNGIKNDNRPENLIAMPSKKHYLILQEKAKRIRALEAEVKLLEKTLNDSQMIFRLEEN